MGPLDGAAVDAGIVLGGPTLCTLSVVGYDESPLLAHAALQRGFPEAIRGLRWVPQGSSDTWAPMRLRIEKARRISVDALEG
jgi:hypothetical protein